MEERQDLHPYSPLHSSPCLVTMLLTILSWGLSVATRFLVCLTWPILMLPTAHICTLVHILQPFCWLRGLIKLEMGGTVIALKTFTYVTSSGLLVCRLPIVCPSVGDNLEEEIKYLRGCWRKGPLCWAGGVFYTTAWTTLILPKGVALV